MMVRQIWSPQGFGCCHIPDSHLSLQKEPSEVPTPKRPRGRPKGSKNKGAAKTRVRLLCVYAKRICGSLLIVEIAVPRTVEKPS